MHENVEALPRLISGERTTECIQPAAVAGKLPNPDFSINSWYRQSDVQRPPLRVGVLINGTMAQLFMRKILEDVLGSNFAQLVAVIENAAPTSSPPVKRSALAKIANTFLDGTRRRGLGYFAYMRKLDRRFRVQPDPCAAVDCSDLFEGVERIRVVPIQKGFVDRFPTDAIERIKALELDVILRFGFRIIRGEILHAARYGVWSYHHGDSERYRGGPALMWELMENNPLSGAVLQRLEESLDAGPVFVRGMLSTAPRPSVSMNRFNVYWSTQHFVIQKLNELHRFGWEHLQKKVFRPQQYRGKRAIYRQPNNLEMAKWLMPVGMRAATRKLRSSSDITHWRIAVRRASEPLYRQTSPSLTGFQWIESPRGRFWADPFLVLEAGETWAVFEDFIYAEQRGVIAAGKVENGRLVDVRTILDRPYHLSYPYIFKHEGATWMIPETEHAGQIQLDRARRFPDDWVLDSVLLDMAASDSSLFRFEGRWYMFVSPRIVAGAVSMTLLFEAPTPQGPWKLHPAGAVSNDVRWARCGGSVIEDQGRLLRVSQDCSNGYGYSVSFNEFKIGSTTYEEKPVSVLAPEPKRSGIFGVHTFNRVGDWEVIDGRAPIRRARVM
jgi:hypothetical protein